jgi:hypothetical protein
MSGVLEMVTASKAPAEADTTATPASPKVSQSHFLGVFSGEGSAKKLEELKIDTNSLADKKYCMGDPPSHQKSKKSD